MLKSLLKVTILVLIANSLAFVLVDFAKSTNLTEQVNPNFQIEELEQPSRSPDMLEISPRSEWEPKSDGSLG